MSKFLAPAIAVGLFVGSALVGAAELTPAPTFEPQIKPGDNITISHQGTRLMIGDQVVRALTKGQPALVAQVSGSWVGVHVNNGARTASGWIRLADIVPASAPAAACNPGPQTYMAAYRAEAPQAVVGSTGDSVAVATPVLSRTSDDYMIGYYQRHETDPNMHVWEPWRR